MWGQPRGGSSPLFGTTFRFYPLTDLIYTPRSNLRKGLPAHATAPTKLYNPRKDVLMARFLHTRIRVGDLERSIEWYCTHLGFEVRSRSDK